MNQRYMEFINLSYEGLLKAIQTAETILRHNKTFIVTLPPADKIHIIKANEVIEQGLKRLYDEKATRGL